MATAEEFVKSTLIAARKQLREEEEEARRAADQKLAKSSNLPPNTGGETEARSQAQRTQDSDTVAQGNQRAYG